MSRSGYIDDSDDTWGLIRWRGAVQAAIRGSRGQALLRALRDALDSMPEKRLIAGELIQSDGECCALGRLAQVQGLDVSETDPEDRDAVGKLFNIAPALAAEIVYENDECSAWSECNGIWGRHEAPEQRWQRMRDWVEKNISPEGGA